MIKIDNLKLNKNNKDILEKYQIYILTVKQKEEKTTVSSYIEDIYKYLEYMENNKIKTALNIEYQDITNYLKYLDNNNYETSSIIRKIVSIKLFHKYLSEEYKIKDVSSKIINPRVRRKLPNILTIEDASAGIGDNKNKLGRHSDIILASTGSPKIINVGQGGFIASNNEEIFKQSSLPQKLSKTSQIVCAGIDSELDNVGKKLEDTVNATDYIKKHIDSALHKDKRGINVIIPHDDAKSIGWNLKKTLTTDKSGFITTCPNYNRIKQKAIAVEIKNLDYECLKKENLDKIIEELKLNNLQ